MNASSHIRSICAWMVVAVLATAASPAFAANYTWKTLSGTGNWTDSVNWSGTSATNLYPGSVGSGTADGAFIQAIYTSAPTINLNTSVTIRQLNLGGTTGATTFPVTLSTSNGSTLTLSQTTTTGTAILAVNAAVNSGTNVLAADILVNAATLETRMASVASGTVNLIVAGNVSAGSPGNKILRYTPNNTSTTTAPSLLEYRGNITSGSGTVSMYYRNDMPNSTNTLRLSGTGNTFTNGISFVGGTTGIAILEASPVSGAVGALGTGLVNMGNATGIYNAKLSLGGSPATVTETALISVTGTGGVRKIANIGAGDRILSGTVGVQAVGVTLACESSGDLTFANTIQNVGPININSTGSGKVIFAGAASTFSGPTTVQAGGLQLGTGSSAGTSTITPLAGGTLSLSPYAVTSVTGLAANAGGLTDVGNGFMTVAAGLTTADMLTAIVAGRNGGTWDGTSGITSSTAATETAASVPRSVGWVDNGDGSVSFAYAAPGDTNIDWSIDILDASNFLALGKFDTGLPATWIEGDFSYDGIVDILDAADFFATGLYDAGNYNSAPGTAAGVAAVPEPASLGAIGLVIAAAVFRRRR